MKPPLWSPEEDEHLLQLCGDVPSAMLAGVYNQWASRYGFPQRTAKALAVRAAKHRAQLRAVGAWITTGGMAAVLGLRPSTVNSWTRRYPDLPCKRFGRQKVRYINRNQFKKWVQNGHLGLLGGIERFRLVMLFDDIALAEEIVRDYPGRPQGVEATAKGVRCLDDGRVWPSIMAAAREVYVAHSTLWRGLLLHKPVVGLRFELVDPGLEQ
jgi:hypothetical protein